MKRFGVLVTLLLALGSCADAGNKDTGSESTDPLSPTEQSKDVDVNTGGEVDGFAGDGTAVDLGSGGAAVELGTGGSAVEPGSGGSTAALGSGGSGGSTAVELGSGGGTVVKPGSGGSTVVEPGSGGNPGEDPQTCTASQVASLSVSGSGPHDVTVETNSDPAINEGTIYRPIDLEGVEKLPIFAWGEGGCSLDGGSNSAAMAEIASHGYFVIADGTPNGSGSRSSGDTLLGEPVLLAYITWAINENNKPCSEYYQRLDTSKIATNGFSCGGLMAEETVGDERLTTWGFTSSGGFSASQGLYESVHTPVLMVEGGPSDIAYENGLRDYNGISALGNSVMWFSKDVGHGGDLWSPQGGDFTMINLAWLNWWLKGDEGAGGKSVLVGTSCTYCSNSAWEVMSSNLP